MKRTSCQIKLKTTQISDITITQYNCVNNVTNRLRCSNIYLWSQYRTYNHSTKLCVHSAYRSRLAALTHTLQFILTRPQSVLIAVLGVGTAIDALLKSVNVNIDCAFGLLIDCIQGLN